MAAAGAMLTAILSHAADENGLSERQFEFKSFTIIAAINRTGSRRKIADWRRTERARRDSAKLFGMMVAREGVETPTPAFSVLH
jgi:hypothetical protein